MRRATFTILLLCCAGTATAAGTLEDRLRQQLGAQSAQLREAQAEQGRLAADKARAERERDALRIELDLLRSDLQQQRGRAAALKTERTQRQQLEASLEQTRSSGEQAAQLARDKEAERARLEGRLQQREAQLGDCVARNRKLYDTGREILGAYESVDVVDVLRRREPFTGLKKVELENLVQDYGDRLQQPALPASAPN